MLRFADLNLASAAVASGTAFPGNSFTNTEPPPNVAGRGLILEPAQLTVGLAYRFRRFWLGAELDLSHPLKLEALDTYYNWNWNWNIRVGGRFWIRKRYSVGFGLFTDRSPRRELSTWRISDNYADYYGATLGFEWLTAYRIRKGAKTHKLMMRTTLSLRYAIGLGKVAAMKHGPADLSLEQLSLLEVEPRTP